MTRVRVKIKSKKGKSGTKIASLPVRVAHTDHPKGKPFYEPQVQMTVKVQYDSNGQRRER